MTHEPDWPDGSAADLIRHIVERFHRTLRADLTTIEGLFDRASGDDTVSALYATFSALREELLAHLDKEERVLFPHIVEIEAAAQGKAVPASLDPTVAGAIVAVMGREHARASLALLSLRRISGEFIPPTDATDERRELFARLKAMDEDLRRHIALEDDVLFPRALEIGRTLPPARER